MASLGPLVGGSYLLEAALERGGSSDASHLLFLAPSLAAALLAILSGVLLISTGREMSARAYRGGRAPEEYIAREARRLRLFIVAVSTAMVALGVHAALDSYASYRLAGATTYSDVVVAKWLSLLSLVASALSISWALLLVVERRGLLAPLAAYGGLAIAGFTYLLAAGEPGARLFSLASALAGIMVAVPLFIAAGSFLFMGGVRSGIRGFTLIGSAAILVGAMNMFYPLVDMTDPARVGLWYVVGGAVPSVMFLAGSLMLMRSEDWIHAIIYLGLAGELSSD